MLRDRLYETEGIVLSRLDYGEADRILVVFTPDYGRLDVIAKGTRKAKSRSGPYLDLCNWVRLDLARGRELDVVRSAQSVRVFTRLRADLEVYGYAHYVCEIVRTLTHPQEPHVAIFDLLARSLVLLDDGVDPWMVTRHFESAVLEDLGYRPELFRCVGCGEPITAQANAFSFERGGLICPSCRDADPTAAPVSVNAQKYLRILQRDGLTAVARLSPSIAERAEIEAVLGGFIRYVAEKDMQSLRVLREMQQKYQV